MRGLVFCRMLTGMRRLFRADRGATDPILVVAAIAVSLVLLTGGAFAYAGFTSYSQNTSAEASLSDVALAEAATLNATGAYTNSGVYLTFDGVTRVVYPPSTQFFVGTNCFAAFIHSASGQWFYNTSASGAPTPVPLPWPATAPSGFPTGCSWPATTLAG